jgi:hypothetical protein
MRWRGWLRHCATSRQFVGLIPDVVIGIFYWHKPFRPPYGPGVDSASNRDEYQEYFLEGKVGRCVGLTTLPLSCAASVWMSLNFYEHGHEWFCLWCRCVSAKKVFMRYSMQQTNMKMQINGKIVHKGYEYLWVSADLTPGLLNSASEAGVNGFSTWTFYQWWIAPGALSAGGWVSPTDGVDTLEKRQLLLPGIGLRFLCYTACNLVTTLIMVPPLAVREKGIDLNVLTLLIRENY